MEVNWVSTEIQVPKDRQEVLIRLGDHVQRAIYRSDEECFVLADNYIVKICDGVNYWRSA